MPRRRACRDRGEPEPRCARITSYNVCYTKLLRHKPNTAVAQAFYNKEAGIKKITTETGAGQWGSSLAFAGALFGIEVKVFMVRVSYT